VAAVSHPISWDTENDAVVSGHVFRAIAQHYEVASSGTPDSGPSPQGISVSLYAASRFRQSTSGPST
jgi:hypothetical protein